ncbi:hypothetical protein [Miltoncostaea oceani]|uniref:hypothetical protein n=1 Tax=Miltoncostaea oceani TaxID=2843216 RepID=UPI001C3D2787|nr:hypothetical protein [Miltoncostaea oceani]
MWSPRARAERRLRERGRPAWAEVTAAERVGDGRWLLRLRVADGGAAPFAATAEVDDADPAGPPVGGRVEVLHGPRRGGRVLALGAPSPPAAPRAEPLDPGPPPDLAMVLRGLTRALGDGSLKAGLPVVVQADDPAAPPSPLAGLSLDALAARAGDDPGAVVDEATRRVGAGEATMGDVLAAARRAGLGRAELARLVRAGRRPAS